MELDELATLSRMRRTMVRPGTNRPSTEGEQQVGSSKKRRQASIRGTATTRLQKSIEMEAIEEDESGQEEEGGSEEPSVGVKQENHDDRNVRKDGRSFYKHQMQTNEIIIGIDPDVLDCCICYQPLRPPLFQCQFGHVACSSCCSKLLNKCCVCSHTIGDSRCLALEKVIEAIKIQCSNSKYGCKTKLSYSQRHAHEQRCTHAPCCCPFNNCLYRGSTRMLLGHLRRKHHHSPNNFSYNQTFRVDVVRTDPFLLLLGDDGHLFLIINSDGERLGRAFSVACIRALTLEWNFSYELTAIQEGSFLQLRSSTKNIQDLINYHPPKVFLTVPADFAAATGKITLDVRIQRMISAADAE